ncbi:structure-specific endonuclease subunit SLX4 [Xylariales sp. AK1849]|nr:structure-specific endonuclease subunit SLX4 [Xylariales sp. AK1849]
MSTINLVMSSPARPARFDNYPMNSSSPELPSLGEIFRRVPKRAALLRSGSNAAPIPTAARSSFASAADILREAPEIDLDTEKITYSPPRKAKPTNKSRAKAQPQQEAPTAIATDASTNINMSPRDKPWQKFKGKKAPTEDGQVTLPKGRVTKAAATDKGKAKKKTETVSKHFAAVKELDPETGGQQRPGTPIEIMPQQPALARRIDWTPPPANSIVLLDSEPDNRELLSPIDKAVATKDVFQNLFHEYACKIDEAQTRPSIPTAEPVNDTLRKRKRLELVSTSDDKPLSPGEPSPIKLPAPKRKTRTITELATAPYAIPEISIDLLAPGSKESLLKYFDTEGHVKLLVENQSIAMEREGSKGKKKPATKPKKSKKKGTVENPILLSPNSALKQSTNQDFVFGTSSQLVLDDSPTLLRDLQVAVQNSNRESDPFVSSPTRPPTGRRGLWHAGARDVDGDLLNIELVHLVNNERLTLENPGSSNEITTIPSGQPPLDEEFVDIADIISSSPRAATTSTDPKSRFSQSQQPTSSTTTVGNTSSSSSSTQQASSNKDTAPTPRPKYELFTDAQLAKQVTTFGFKPLKKRQAMIALLDQCWASQHPGSSITQASIGATASMSTSATVNTLNKASPKRTKAAASPTPSEPVKKSRSRPRKDAKSTTSTMTSDSAPPAASRKKSPGRPRKTAAKKSSSTSDDGTTITRPVSEPKPVTPSKRKKTVRKAVEIADSDIDDSLSLSPQSSPDHVFSSPPPLDLSMSEAGDMSLNLTPTDQEATLFTHITKAVTSAPPTKDTSNPSWHEKMLLYDPVVLEDLAAWLNAGELTRVGYDGEVSPGEVKKWCESKSVVCLWRVNLNGKERKRY